MAFFRVPIISELFSVSNPGKSAQKLVAQKWPLRAEEAFGVRQAEAVGFMRFFAFLALRIRGEVIILSR